MKIDRIDHLVLTVKDIEATCSFYNQVLGMEVALENGRKSLELVAKRPEDDEQAAEVEEAFE